MNFHWICFIYLIISMKDLSLEGKTYFVSNSDDQDDSIGIQSAIHDAIQHGMNNEIVFGYGIYTIESTIQIENGINLTIRGQGIDQTFLIGLNEIAIFNVIDCQGIELKSFSIDYNPLPFTAGYVVNIENQFIDVQVIPPHETDINRQVQSILRYDPQEMRPAFGFHTYEISQDPPSDVNTTIVSPGVLRLPLRSSTQFVKGDPIVVRYVFRAYGIYCQDILDLTIQSVTIYTAWSMAFVTLRTERVNLIDFHVLSREGRWMSSIADCIHMTHSKQFVNIIDSRCQSMGDDGLNVHGSFFLVTQVINSSSIVIKATNWTYSIDLGIGTNVEFSHHDQPFTIHGNGTIASILFNSTNTRNLTFTNPINVTLGDWLCISDTPRLTINNFTVANNRARGVLLETRNIDISRSIFNRTSGPAILIQPSMFWTEGPEARNITLRENLFFENNQGIAREKGIISILPDPIQFNPVIYDLQILSSTFYLGRFTENLLQSDNLNNLFIRGNYISSNNFTSLISICNSRNLTAENNCLVTNQTQINEIYQFDENYPCSMNLSSQIHLPISAFNSSFAPPVEINVLSFEKSILDRNFRKLIE